MAKATHAPVSHRVLGRFNMESSVVPLLIQRCASAPTANVRACSNDPSYKEKAMYWGGGLLGTILVVVLIIWLVRRI
jgi:hypothetical protein